jgi:hypothetical protein
MVLKLKRDILRRLIDENSDDPRVDEPKRQLAEIEAMIDTKVVQLKPLELHGRFNGRR